MKSLRLLFILAAAAAFGFSGCGEDGNAIPINGEPDSGKTSDSGESEISVSPDDLDGDGLSNELEATLGTDPNKADTDGDGLKDGEEIAKDTDPTKADTDDDGLNDADEIVKGTDPKKADTDDDGLNDADEIAKGSDPLKPDTDADDLKDGQEVELGTDPTKADTDGDGVNDGEEVSRGTNPLKATADADGDGLLDEKEEELGTDPNKADTDGDGANDLVEYMLKTNPTDPADNPDSHNLTWFLTPYQQNVTPSSATQSFIPVVQKLDIYFDGKIQEYKTSKNAVNLFKTLESLKCTDSGQACQSNADCISDDKSDVICGESGTCIQQSTTKSPCFADLWTGTGSFNKVDSFVNDLSLQSDLAKTKEVNVGFSPNTNSDYVHSTACAIGGAEYCANADTINCYSGDDRFGCVGYRKDAIKGLMLSAHQKVLVGWNVNNDDLIKAGKIITDNNIRLMALSWASCSCQNGVSQLVCYANACDANQSCFEDCTDATSICDKRVESIYFGGATYDPSNYAWDNNYDKMIKRMATYRVVTIEPKVVAVTENADKLVQKLTVNKSGETVKKGVCTAISNAISGDNFESIESLTPGTSICYDITPVSKQDVVPATSEPQLLEARIQVTAEGSVLNSDHVYFVIPPAF